MGGMGHACGLSRGAVVLTSLAIGGARREADRRDLRIFASAYVAGGALLVTKSALLAARNVTSLFVAPQSAELALLRSNVASVRPDASHITVVMSSWRAPAAPLVRYDEFGFPSTASPDDLAAEVYLIVKEERPRAERARRRCPSPGSTSRRPPESVIDMGSLAKLRSGWKFWTLKG